MLFTQILQQRCYLQNLYYTWIAKNGFFHFINFDKHVVTTDVTVALGLVSQSFLSDTTQAGTEFLSINLKQYIPHCSVTKSICIDIRGVETMKSGNRPRKEQWAKPISFLSLGKKRTFF